MVGHLGRTFVAGFAKGIDVPGFLVSGGGLETQMRVGKNVRRTVSQECAVLQRTAAEFEGQRIAAAGEIQLGDFKNTTRGGLDFSTRRIGGASEALNFEAASVGDGVALGFLDQHDDVLVGFGAGGILRSDGNAIEDSKIVEAALGVDYFALAQRFGRFDLHLTPDHTRPSVIVAGD